MFSHNYLLFFEYDGTRYSGWQKQPAVKTIQGTIENAIFCVLGSDFKLISSSRTDKGVHAFACAANLLCHTPFVLYKLQAALNKHLPEDIAVTKVKRVPLSFNARFNALEKVYRYVIWNNRNRSVWHKGYAWYLSPPLNVSHMKDAGSFLLGSHDFSSFMASGGGQINKIVQLKGVSIIKKRHEVIMLFKANRFLYKMVRSLVGSLVNVGLGRMEPGKIKELLFQKKRHPLIRTAPACGLYLEKVIY